MVKSLLALAAAAALVLGGGCDKSATPPAPATPPARDDDDGHASDPASDPALATALRKTAEDLGYQLRKLAMEAPDELVYKQMEKASRALEDNGATDDFVRLQGHIKARLGQDAVPLLVKLIETEKVMCLAGMWRLMGVKTPSEEYNTRRQIMKSYWLTGFTNPQAELAASPSRLPSWTSCAPNSLSAPWKKDMYETFRGDGLEPPALQRCLLRSNEPLHVLKKRASDVNWDEGVTILEEIIRTGTAYYTTSKNLQQ